MTKPKEPNGDQHDPIEAAYEALGGHRKFNIGDLVWLAGEYYVIDGYVIEAARMADIESEEIRYEMTRAFCDGTWEDFAMGYEEDLQFITNETEALDYIESLIEGGIAMDFFYQGDMNFEKDGKSGDDAPAAPSKHPHRERENTEVQRRKDYRAYVDGRLIELQAAKDQGDQARADEVLRDLNVRAAIFEAGGDVE